jgi:hypothetical protein
MALSWEDVAGRLTTARLYWLHTTTASGAPHAAPTWGVVMDAALYVYTFRSSLKSRNLARDPRVAIHLESGADVVIVHGRLRDLGHPRDHAAVLDAFAAKYDEPWERPFLPANDAAFDVLYVLAPERATTWTLPDSEASTRRWTASG